MTYRKQMWSHKEAALFLSVMICRVDKPIKELKSKFTIGGREYSTLCHSGQSQMKLATCPSSPPLQILSFLHTHVIKQCKQSATYTDTCHFISTSTLSSCSWYVSHPCGRLPVLMGVSLTNISAGCQCIAGVNICGLWNMPLWPGMCYGNRVLL